MAKLEEPQNIPSELLDPYRATLNPHPTGNIVKKRYPFRMPRMQEGGKGVHAGQKAQRARFKTAMADFRNVSAPVRARWYAAEPPWSSFLWYYNYFIMSSLVGNANIAQGGVGVIKTIQRFIDTVSNTAPKDFTLDPVVDPLKTVVLFNGIAKKVPKVLRGKGSVAVAGSTLAIGDTIDPDKCTVRLFGTGIKDGGAAGAVAVYPYIDALRATEIDLKFSEAPDDAADISWEITEHVEKDIEPIVVYVHADEVRVSWAETPDASANVSVTVIEYI